MYVCFTLLLIWPKGQNRKLFDQFTLLIWPKGQNRKLFDQFTFLIWPKGQKEREREREGICWPLWVGKLPCKCKAQKKIMGFEGLPKQPRLPPENLAFSSVFQVCFKCVNFFYLSYILILLIIFTFLLLTSYNTFIINDSIHIFMMMYNTSIQIYSIYNNI